MRPCSYILLILVVYNAVNDYVLDCFQELENQIKSEVYLYLLDSLGVLFGYLPVMRCELSCTTEHPHQLPVCFNRPLRKIP